MSKKVFLLVFSTLLRNPHIAITTGDWDDLLPVDKLEEILNDYATPVLK